MDATERYDELATAFGRQVEGVPPAAWDRPSPCDGWSAADVLDHVMTTQRDFLAEHGHDVCAPDPDAPPAERWRSHADEVRALLAREGIAETGFDGFFGPTTLGEALSRFYGFDMVVHRWDLARALGRDTSFSTEEAALVADSIESFGPAITMEGICRPAVDAGPSPSETERLVALTGRDPGWTAPA